MHQAILCVVAALAVFGMAAGSVLADDNSTCASGTGDDAVAACSRLIGKNPKNAVAYYNRGNSYLNKREHNLAIADYDRAIGLDPKYAYAYGNRGVAYNQKGDRDRALADYDQAIRLDPRNAVPYVNRSESYVLRGEYDRAVADANEAIRLDPKIAAAYFNRGNSYLNKGEYDPAIADYDRAIGLDPKYAYAYSNRGVAYNRKGDHDRALADFDQAVRLDPKNAAAYVNRSDGYIYKGEYDRAADDASEAIRLDPKNAVAYNNRGQAYEGKSDPDRAIVDYDQAIRLNPKYANAYNRRGRAYEAKNDPDRALTDYDQALKLDPNLADARRGRERVRVLLAKWSDPGAQTASTTPALPAKRALVIGINTYPNLGGAAQLERAAADADAVGDKLASLGFQVTRLTTAPQTTLDAIIHGFDDFQKTIAPNDMVVLFYAGHGMGLPDGTYLVPGDIREASLQVEATAKRATISENELTDGLRRARAGIVVAVIDACRNDLFSRATRRAMGNERGLRPIETEGIFKLYSASEGQTALDRLPGSDGSRNSVFTRVFLKAIGTPGLNLNTLGATVRDEVHELARTADHEQTPAVYDKLIGSTRVYFGGETAAADAGRRQ